MNELFVSLLSMSIAGTFLIFILYILRPFYKNKVSKSWQYYIWILVIARLLLPFASETSLIGNWFTDINEHIVQPVANAYFGSEESSYSDTGTDNNLPASNTLKASEPTLSFQNDETQIPNIWLVWFVAALVLLIRKITIYQSFVKYVRAGSKEVNDIECLEQFGKMVDTQKIKTGIQLYTNSLISSPLLIGFWKPYIILPTTDMSASDFRYTILHELTHYKRRDMIYKWLTQVAICLHWFNPFVYLLSKEINRACELSCDEAVISKLDRQGRRSYGDTLLNAVKSDGNYKNSVASVTLCESKILLGERLSSIMDYKKQSKKIICLSVLLIVLLLCGAAYAGAYPIKKGTNSWQAPDNIPVNTAKADAVTQIESPDVDITIDDFSAVTFVLTNEDEFRVDYGESLYNVDVSNENGDWKIHIAYIGEYSKYPAAILYIPDISYGDVKIQAKQATVYINNIFKNTDNIDANMELSSIFYTVPSGFTGEFNAIIPDSYLEMRSEDDYKNCDITISNCTSFGEMADNFSKQGNQFTYSNGTGAGVINIDFEGGGYADISSQSSVLKSDFTSEDETLSFPLSTESSSEVNIKAYTADSSGIVKIPVAISTINSGTEICIGEILDIRNAEKIIYNIQSQNTGSLCVGIRSAKETGIGKQWYCYVQRQSGNIDWETDDSLGYDTEYNGKYYVYIQSLYGDCTDISGLITVIYKK